MPLFSSELDRAAETGIVTRAQVLSFDLPASQLALAPACGVAALVFAWSALVVSPAMGHTTGLDVPWLSLGAAVLCGLAAAGAGGWLGRLPHRADAATYGAISGAIVALAASWMVVPWVALWEAYRPGVIDVAHVGPKDTGWLSPMLANQLDAVMAWNAAIFGGLIVGGAACGALGAALRSPQPTTAAARPALDLQLVLALNLAAAMLWVATGPGCAPLAEAMADPSGGGDASAVLRLVKLSHVTLVAVAVLTLRGIPRPLRGDPLAVLRLLGVAFPVLASAGAHWSGDGLSTAFWAGTWVLGAAAGWATRTSPTRRTHDERPFNLVGSAIRGVLVTFAMGLVGVLAMQFGVAVVLGAVAWIDPVRLHQPAPTWVDAALGLAAIEAYVAIGTCGGALTGLTRALLFLGMVSSGRVWRAARAWRPRG